MTRAASREWPPSSKKLSFALTRGRRNTSAQTPAMISSAGVRYWSVPSGPTEDGSGTGRALRSILPLGVSGSASSTTNADGVMYSGSRPRRWPSSSRGQGLPWPSAST